MIRQLADETFFMAANILYAGPRLRFSATVSA